MLLVLLDDVGFGHPSAFGGPVATPTLERLAARGLRYTRFHTTGLGAPTRAALLTGRNHHAVHMGAPVEEDGEPGPDGVWPARTACVAEVLRQGGYNTAAFGKWENTPPYETSAAGPFDRWPTGLGFEYFYGFLGAAASQWEPPLYENTVPIERPAPGAPGGTWHLTTALADRAIDWLRVQRAAAPERPFFVYLALGAAHAPHHVARAFADRYAGRFDDGWDVERGRTLERQIRLGVVPSGTELPPRPPQIPGWDTLGADERRLFSRMQEVFAGFLEHADREIGRVLDALAEMGAESETLVVYVAGDSGPSAEGSLTGTLNATKTQQGFTEDVGAMAAQIDEIGGPLHENHLPVGWALAGAAPFSSCKPMASHLGGTRNGLVVAWPTGIEGAGGLRTQFHHVIDVVPTILDVAGIDLPGMVNGVPQRPLDGVSMVYTFDDAHAEGRRRIQHFEISGNRALYHDGWIACARHGRSPWAPGGARGRLDEDRWELYDLDEDFSQARDLADVRPDKLRELQDLYFAEAGRHDVLPAPAFAARGEPAPPPVTERTRLELYPGVRLPESAVPGMKSRSHLLAFDVDVPDDGCEGVLLAAGGRAGGFSVFVVGARLFYAYNFFGEAHTVVRSSVAVPVGRGLLAVTFTFDDARPGAGGTARLVVDDRVVGEVHVPRTIPRRYTAGETLDVGRDTVTPVSELYESPFPFTGIIHRVFVDLEIGGRRAAEIGSEISRSVH